MEWGTGLIERKGCSERRKGCSQSPEYSRKLRPPKRATWSKMKEMGYGNIVIKPFPYFTEEKDFSKVDWYRVIGEKPAC